MNKLAKQLYRLAFNIYSYNLKQNVVQNIIKEFKKANLKFEEWLEKKGLTTDQFFELLNQTDPNPQNPNNKLAIFVAKEWINKRIDLPEDAPVIREDFEQLLKYQDKLRGFNFLKETIHDLRDKLEGIIKGLKQEEVAEISQDLILATDTNDKGDRFLAIKIETPEQAVELCKDSKWCVRHKGTATGYLKGGKNFILIRKNGKNYVLLTHAPQSARISDIKDRNDKDASKEIGEEIYPIVQKVFKNNKRTLLTLKYLFGKADSFNRKELEDENIPPAVIIELGIKNSSDRKERDPKFEKYLEKHGDGQNDILDYMRAVEMKERWLKIEKNLVPFSKYLQILGPFKRSKAFENFILKFKPLSIATYMQQAGMNERWEEAEKLFDENPFIILDYLKQAEVSERIPKFEKIILKSFSSPGHGAQSRELIEYMKFINLKERWPELEDEIEKLKSLPFKVLVDKFEGVIAYRNKAGITERWPWLEKNLLSSFFINSNRAKFLLMEYAETLKQRYPELEKIFLQDVNFGMDIFLGLKAINYFRAVGIKERIPELEPVLDTIIALPYVAAAGSDKFKQEEVGFPLELAYVSGVIERLFKDFRMPVEYDYDDTKVQLIYEFLNQERFIISKEQICLRDDYIFLPLEEEGPIETLYQDDFLKTIKTVNQKFRQHPELKEIQFPEPTMGNPQVCVPMPKELLKK